MEQGVVVRRPWRDAVRFGLSIILIIISTAGCSAARVPGTDRSEPPSPAAASPTLPQTGPSATPTLSPSPTASVEPSPSTDPLVAIHAMFDVARFSRPAEIDNAWLPLTPGRRWIFEGITIEEGERVSHRITFTVTRLTKVIAGVETRVVWIEDFSEGELVEREIAFYAQDDEGTVWYLGEHPEEFEDGEFVGAPTWIAGLEDALPGIKMLADPVSHTQTYYQGWAPSVEWSDFSRLDEAGLQDCVVFGCFDEVVRFAESSDTEQGIFQLKSYARDVGEIRVGWRGEADSREELELKSTAVLRGEKLDRIDELALELERHAYVVSPKSYGQTEPIVVP